MALWSTWDQWRTAERTFLVRGEDRGCAAWHYVKVEDNLEYSNHDALATGHVDVADYGEIVKSGWGKDPTDDVEKEIEEKYFVNYD